MARQRKAARKRAVRVYPLPEVVTGGKQWTIRESGGRVPYADVVHRDMGVPTGTSPIDAAIRLHEMAHARWTPTNAAKLGQDAGVLHPTLNACEDARIQRRLVEAGFPLRSVLEDQHVAQHARRYEDGQVSALEAASLLMASIGTGDEPVFTRLMREAGMQVIEQVTRRVYRSHFGGRRPAVQRSIDAALELESWFRDDPDPEILDSLEMPEDLPEDYDEGEDIAVGWGRMKITEPKRPLRLPPRIRAPKRRASPEGSFPRNWHRLPVDGAVFARRHKRPAGGSVLIDQSGSMSFTPDDVLAILEAAPAAIVATYCGTDYSGELRIIARDGRRVEDADIWIEGGNNTVDGPALEWLAHQDGPRFWVSDGEATAPTGGHGRAVIEAARLALVGRIRRVGTVEDLLTEAL